MVRLLLIEDDKVLNDTICFFLKSNGIDAVGCFCADEAFSHMSHGRFDIVLTDVMLPTEDGFEIAKTLRACDPVLPIIFLTALDDSSFKEKGYSLGIDDYMTKPADLKELLWRINALLRRAGINSAKKLNVGNLTLESASQRAVCDGEELPLTVREFNILFKFLAYPGKIFTRSRLMDEFWESESESTLRSVDVYITKIREKTKNCRGFEIITVRGLGYKSVITGDELI